MVRVRVRVRIRVGIRVKRVKSDKRVKRARLTFGVGGLRFKV
jgi:hypothetical protein